MVGSGLGLQDKHHDSRGLVFMAASAALGVKPKELSVNVW